MHPLLEEDVWNQIFLHHPKKNIKVEKIRTLCSYMFWKYLVTQPFQDSYVLLTYRFPLNKSTTTLKYLSLSYDEQGLWPSEANVEI